MNGGGGDSDKIEIESGNNKPNHSRLHKAPYHKFIPCVSVNIHIF
jgi:hypothetical protein